jgi:hypothetical protein
MSWVQIPSQALVSRALANTKADESKNLPMGT